MARNVYYVISISIVLFVSFYPLDLGFVEVLLTTLLVLLLSFIHYDNNFLIALGFSKKGFKTTPLLVHAPLAAMLLFLLYYFILLPMATYITKVPIDFSDFYYLKGNTLAIITALPFIWISAAFGEEIIWRGFLLQHCIKLLGGRQWSIVISILLLAALFGGMHSYQGPTGIIVTSILGGLLSYIFYKRGYDLWFTIMVHGFFDTIALLVVYLGWI